MKCVLFDADGTLFDTADAIKRAVRETALEFSLDINVDQAVSDALNVLEGRKSKLNFLILGIHYKFVSWKHPFRVFQIKKDFDKRFFTYTREDKLVPGVREALEDLKSVRLAVVTSRSREWTEVSLENCGIAGYFEVVVTTDDVERDKPHPGPVLKAVALLGVEPGECLYVGDLPSDIRAGKRAGVRTAAVLTGLSSRERLERENPDFIFENLRELASFWRERTG